MSVQYLNRKIQKSFSGGKISMQLRRHHAVAVFAVALCSLSVQAMTPKEYSKSLYQNIVGINGTPTDKTFKEVNELVAKGKLEDAARLAVGTDGFVNVTLRTWASQILTKDETPYEPLNDAMAILVGVAKDDTNFRKVITGNFGYGPDPRIAPIRALRNSNINYDSFETAGRSWKQFLTRYEPQWEEMSSSQEDEDTAGVLSSRAWAEKYYSAGTNRRAVEATYRAFLCTAIDSWKESDLPINYIRRDVERAPGGNPETFTNKCQLCHSQMDAFGGAFAHLDFAGGSFNHSEEILPKYNQNTNVYPAGYVTTTTQWHNFASDRSQQMFGWRTALSGVGLKSFGKMVANSEGFSRCMAKRVFKKVCHKELGPQDTELTRQLAKDFENSDYKIKSLFVKVVVNPACLGSVE